MSERTETKERILDAFIEMASTLGYENVTMRDIAKKVGINSASIYYHYESKDRILEYAYEFFTRHYFDNRKSSAIMKKLIETATAEEIIEALSRSYESDDPKKYFRMILINKIVYMRLFQDQVAGSMFVENNANDARYVIDIMQHGINVGRIYPDFDIVTFAEVLIGSQVAMGVKAYASPGYEICELDEKARILAMISKLFATALIQ